MSWQKIDNITWTLGKKEELFKKYCRYCPHMHDDRMGTQIFSLICKKYDNIKCEIAIDNCDIVKLNRKLKKIKE